MNKKAQTYIAQPTSDDIKEINKPTEIPKEKSLLKRGELSQKTFSSIITVIGVIIILITTNTFITGQAIAENSVNNSLTPLNLFIIFWGSLLLIVGIWMRFKKPDII